MSFFSDIQNIFEETFKTIYESQQPCINYIEMSKLYYSLFFGLMKIIDSAQSFSKTQCIEEFES